MVTPSPGEGVALHVGVFPFGKLHGIDMAVGSHTVGLGTMDGHGLRAVVEGGVGRDMDSGTISIGESARHGRIIAGTFAKEGDGTDTVAAYGAFTHGTEPPAMMNRTETGIVFVSFC